METKDIVLDALGRIHSILHRTLTGLTLDEMHRQPSHDTNSIAWLTWHLTRVQDNGISGLFDQEQAWISQGWHAKFGMEPDPDNEGKGTHQRRWLPFVPLQSSSCWITMTASRSGPKPF